MKPSMTLRRMVLVASLCGSVIAAYEVSRAGADAATVVAAIPHTRSTERRATGGASPYVRQANETHAVTDTEGFAQIKLQPRHFDTDAGELFEVPAPAAPVNVDVKPVVPPLPFTFLGRINDDKAVAVMLAQANGEPIVAHQGDTIDSRYRLEAVSDDALTFVYLPLKHKQTLALNGTGASADSHNNDKQ